MLMPLKYLAIQMGYDNANFNIIGNTFKLIDEWTWKANSNEKLIPKSNPFQQYDN